jgi:hypothetical protein
MGTYILTLDGQQIFPQVGQFIRGQVADGLQAWQGSIVQADAQVVDESGPMPFIMQHPISHCVGYLHPIGSRPASIVLEVEIRGKDRVI